MIELLTAAPLRARSITWQEHPGQWMLTVVCKATYTLAADRCRSPPEQEDVAESDNHWDDDPAEEPLRAGDLAPYKANPRSCWWAAPSPREARWSGSSPSGSSALASTRRSTSTDRARASVTGTSCDGPGWSQMPLRYERAAGGESWNPVGVDPEVQDAFGRRPLPNLQPPGAAARAAAHLRAGGLRAHLVDVARAPRQARPPRLDLVRPGLGRDPAGGGVRPVVLPGGPDRSAGRRAPARSSPSSSRTCTPTGRAWSPASRGSARG